MDLMAYYSRKDVLKEMLSLAKDREVQVWFGDMRGRRPDIVNFEGDILDMVKKGMTSFHVSVERWSDALSLKPGMLKRNLDTLRCGWDLLLDLDSKWVESSYHTAVLLIDALNFHDVKSYGVKFSGNHGFHLVVPFEAFPDEVNSINIKNHFPDGLRVIANYLKYMIKDHLAAKLLEKDIEFIAAQVGKPKEELMVDGKFDPYTVVDIDSVLISSRHMFRGSYSLNEKSGLVSVPLENIKDFKLETYKEDFKPSNVKVGAKFLKRAVKGEASKLVVQAFDWNSKSGRVMIKEKEKKKANFEIPQVEIDEKFFPPCIVSLFSGVKDDGRKRSVFVLVNFLRSVGWSWERVEEKLLDINGKSYEPLPEGYIRTQINWSKRGNKNILPPNCGNKAYYGSMGICSRNCKVKNPVNYVFRMLKMQKKKRKKVSKKI